MGLLAALWAGGSMGVGWRGVCVAVVAWWVVATAGVGFIPNSLPAASRSFGPVFGGLPHELVDVLVSIAGVARSVGGGVATWSRPSSDVVATWLRSSCARA
jgi:hypothetical protein